MVAPGTGGPGGGRRIQAGTIEYKFVVKVDESIEAQIREHVKYAETLLKEIKDLNAQYGKIQENSTSSFKALGLAAAGFFALMIANSSVAKDMFGAVFSSLGTVMDALSMIFLPLVTEIVEKLAVLATHIYDVISGAGDMGDAFRSMSSLITQGLIGALEFSVKFAIGFALQGIPTINSGIEDAVRGLPPGIRELASFLLEDAAYGMAAGLVSKGLVAVGAMDSPISLGTAVGIGAGMAEWGNLMNAVHGDKHAQMMGIGFLGGAGVGAGIGMIGGFGLGGTLLTAGAGALIGQSAAGGVFDAVLPNYNFGTSPHQSPATSSASAPDTTPDTLAPAGGGGGLSGPIQVNAPVTAQPQVNVQYTTNVYSSPQMTFGNMMTGQGGTTIVQQTQTPNSKTV